MAVDNITMGKKLRKIREENNMTQTEFALKLNISQQTLSKYENGKVTIPYNELRNVAMTYSISLEEMFEIDCYEFTSEEICIVEYYRNINDDFKTTAKLFLRQMQESFPNSMRIDNVEKDRGKN